LTLFLHVPADVSAARLRSRQATLPLSATASKRRTEIFRARRARLRRHCRGEPQRVRFINGAQPMDVVVRDLENRPAAPAKVGRW